MENCYTRDKKVELIDVLRHTGYCFFMASLCYNEIGDF